ncbi:MAG: DUF2760 domain-containing protein [Terrimicrobiaceae bacterium]
MKPYLQIAAVLVAVLNSLLLVPAASAYTFSIAVLALVLALIVVALSFVSSPQQTPPPATVPVAAQPPPPPANQAEAEVVAFVGLLQEKGRFVDFLMEDVGSYDDTQVGAAARVVHQGCRAVLNEHFKIAPVSPAEEGSRVTVPADYTADEYRLTGKISGEPPFTGTLIHKGWKTDSVKLPRILKTSETRLPAIAPAQVELK